jgi:hypothetical protein
MISVRTNRILERHVDVAWLNSHDLIPEIPLGQDSYEELLRKLTLVHGYMWQLEDDISLHYDDDHYVAQIKRELDRCFKNIRPRLIERLNVLAVQSAGGDADVDEFLSTCVRETLASGASPVPGSMIPDSFGEIIERLCILKVRVWKLRHALEGDTQSLDSRDRIELKLQQCIDVMLPRYLQALEQVWVRIVTEPHVAAEVSVKFYAEFRGSDVE